MGEIASPPTTHTHIMDKTMQTLCGEEKPHNWTSVQAHMPELSNCDRCREVYFEHHATVHILAAGQAMCGFSQKIPLSWPPDHRWVGYESNPLATATCPECRGSYRTHLQQNPEEAQKIIS